MAYHVRTQLLIANCRSTHHSGFTIWKKSLSMVCVWHYWSRSVFSTALNWLRKILIPFFTEGLLCWRAVEMTEFLSSSGGVLWNDPGQYIVLSDDPQIISEYCQMTLPHISENNRLPHTPNFIYLKIVLRGEESGELIRCQTRLNI